VAGYIDVKLAFVSTNTSLSVLDERLYCQRHASKMPSRIKASCVPHVVGCAVHHGLIRVHKRERERERERERDRETACDLTPLRHNINTTEDEVEAESRFTKKGLTVKKCDR
jgi:hypothetical protein